MTVQVGQAGGGWLMSALQLPDGRIITGSDDNTIRIWDLDLGKPAPKASLVKMMPGHSDWVKCLLLLSDGRVLSGSKDNTLRLWH